MNDEFIIKLIAELEQSKSQKQLNSDIKQLEKALNMIRLTATLAKGDTKKELNAYIQQLSSQLSTLRLKAKIDSKNLKSEIDSALNDVKFKDIDALNIDENKVKLKVRKVIADTKAYVDKNSISVNIDMKKEKLNNDLTTYLGKYSKINESSVLLEEAEKVRGLINVIDDKKSLRDATDAFQLFKSEVSATGFTSKSTTEKIKGMLSNISKIGSMFGVASLAVNNFVKSLQTLKSNDTILTEISKTSEMTKQQLVELGNEAFKTASKYGQLSSNYLLGVQEMARSGYEETSKELGELSLLAQSAGDMTAENANNYLLATDAAYKYSGSIEKLNAALDGANYVSNRNSASLTDIADAVRVSASFAANAEVAIDELTAAEATMIATTKRSGSEIGRAFRSIILNLQGVSGEFDGEVIDEEQLKKVEARCHSLGVELEYLKDGIATLRNPMDVLKDLADVYNSLPDNSADKQGLISDLGGKYHANTLSSLLSRWDLYEKMLAEYSQGTGSALEEANKTADSWEGRLNSLQNSWTSFVNSLTNKETIMGGISFFEKLIQGAQTLTETIGEIPTLLTAVNTAMVALNKDYGITQVVNKDNGKLDIQGNIFGIDFTAIKAQKKHFELSKEAIKAWNNELNAGKTDLEGFNFEVVKNNAQLKEYLATCSKEAPASLSGYKTYLNAAGVSTDALRLKTILLNSAISLGIGVAIQVATKAIAIAVEKIDDLAHASEKCAERVDELMSSYKSALDTANSNAKTVENLASRYEELSKGVNNLGENVSLTTDEYAEYNDIVNQIADMFPTLVQGYTDEGNAILSLKGNVEQLRDAYREAQQEAYNMLIVSGKDSDGNDIIANWKYSLEEDKGNGTNVTQAIKELEAFMTSDIDAEMYTSLREKASAGIYDGMTDAEKLIAGSEFIPFKIQLDLDEDGSITNEEIAKAKESAKVLLQTYKAEIESNFGNLKTLANAYLLTNEDYKKLDEQSKSAASLLVNSIPATSDIAQVLMTGTKEEVGKYVNFLVQALDSDNPEVKNALINLLTLDTEDMSPDEIKSTVDLYISTIADYLHRDENELKIQLGFEDVDEAAKKYENVIGKFGESESNSLKQFFDKNTINTAEEIDYWIEVTKGATNAAEAVKMYNEAKSKNTESSEWDYSTTITQLDTIKEKFDVLDSTLSKLYDTDKSTVIGFNDFSSINEAFKDLDGIETYIQRLQEAGQDTEAVTAVMEDLISSYLEYSGVLDNVTDENRQLITSMLEEMGVANAEEVVNGYLMTSMGEINEAKQALGITTEKLSDLTLNEIQRLIEEGNCSEQTKNKLYELYLTQIDLNNNPIDATASINQLLSMVDASSAAGTALTQLASIMGKIGQLQQYMSTADGEISQSLAKNTLSMLEKQAASIKSNALAEFSKNTTTTPSIKVNPTTSYKGGSSTQKAIKDAAEEAEKAAKSASDAAETVKEAFKETFDFFDQRVNVLDDALSLLKTNLDNVTGSFAKNKLVDAELGITEEKFKNYSDALSMYTKKANEALSKLPSDIAQKIKDGAVDLTTFIGDGNEEVVEAIKDYQNWADKIADCKQELAELKTAIRQLELEKFNNIMEDFTNQFDLHEDGKDLISKQIDLLKEAGQLIGESFFTTQIDQSKKQLAILEEEKAKLVEQLNSALSSGRIQKGTDEWLEMVNALSDVEGSILDAKTAIEEFDNELLQLHWDIFDRIQNQFSNLDSELSNLGGLFDDLKISDGNGNWTNEGIAQLGLLTQQYELAQYQVKQYNEAIDKLNADYLAGKYSATEYADKLAELTSAQWDAVNSSESIKDAIIELNETRINEEIEGIEKEIDAYKELIDAQIDLIDETEALIEKRDTLAGKTKTVTNLERQIAEMMNDDTAATVAKRKKLEEQLAEAKKDLADTEREYSVEAQKNALNKQYENFESEKNDEIETLKASLEERETLIAQSFESVKANADIVGQEIALIATQHGITVSNALISSWQNGETSIASYGAVLSENSSAFIANLMGVESEVYGLQEQANTTADSLSYMFATRADNLVNELTSSYYSEENLNTMTQALRDSLVNTLEGGYNVSGITSALNSIAEGANNVASAANSAAQALAAMGAAQQAVTTTTAKTTYSIHQTGAVDPTYTVKDSKGNIVSSGNTLKQAQDYIKSKNAYASGTRNAKGGLRVVGEEGNELELVKLPSGHYEIGNAGDQILTKAQTDNIFDWSKLNPADLVPYDIIGSLNLKLPDIEPRNVNNNSVNVHYDSLITINGDVNDTKHFLNDMTRVARNEVVDFQKSIMDGAKYRNGLDLKWSMKKH